MKNHIPSRIVASHYPCIESKDERPKQKKLPNSGSESKLRSHHWYIVRSRLSGFDFYLRMLHASPLTLATSPASMPRTKHIRITPRGMQVNMDFASCGRLCSSIHKQTASGTFASWPQKRPSCGALCVSAVKSRLPQRGDNSNDCIKPSKYGLKRRQGRCF